MLKKLRIKFIVLNMATVVVVLAIAFTAILIINQRQSVQDVYDALDTAIAGAQAYAEAEDEWQDSPLFQDDQSQTQLSPDDEEPGLEDQGDVDDGIPPQIGSGRDEESEPVIPVAVYVLQGDGTLLAVSSLNTAVISSDVLSEAATLLADAEEGAGTLADLGLSYKKSTIEGITYLAFADSSATSDWRRLALLLTAIGVLAFVVFFVISLFFSRWALRPVSQAWEQQKQFVADASHDLKTPLTVILANTSILMEHPDKTVSSQSQWVESTEHEAQSMQELVNDLLLLAQLDEGAAHVAFEDVDLTDLVEGELLQFESVAFERGIDLDADIDEGVVVRGNATRLRRLATTLIDNACKYAGANGGQVDVALGLQADGVALRVHNTGSSIAPEDLPHVFDRFYRADKARTHDEGGYGLGLAIAYGIAQEHGGTLTVTSDEATGTTFTALLPRAAKM